MGDELEDDYAREEFKTTVTDDGELVFTNNWDTRGPGAGTGTESVSRWEGQFYAWSADIGFNGPYPTLREALSAHEMLSVTSATTSIWCSLMTTDELLEELYICDDYPPDEITINDAVCVHKGSGYERKRKKR